MAKKFFWFLMILLVGFLSTPGYIWSSTVDAVKIGDSETVEQIDTPELKAELSEISTSFTGAKPVYRSDYRSSPEGYGGGVYGNYISILGKTLSVVYTDTTTADSGNHVNRFRDRFYYGHNSAGVFGNLGSLGIGSTFSITVDGATHNYRVANVVIFEKNTSSGKLQLNGSGSYMNSVAGARYGGRQYSVSLMTCHGTSYGNGDASHRLVVFADEI